MQIREQRKKMNWRTKSKKDWSEFCADCYLLNHYRSVWKRKEVSFIEHWMNLCCAAHLCRMSTESNSEMKINTLHNLMMTVSFFFRCALHHPDSILNSVRTFFFVFFSFVLCIHRIFIFFLFVSIVSSIFSIVIVQLTRWYNLILTVKWAYNQKPCHD